MAMLFEVSSLFVRFKLYRRPTTLTAWIPLVTCPKQVYETKTNFSFSFSAIGFSPKHSSWATFYSKMCLTGGTIL